MEKLVGSFKTVACREVEITEIIEDLSQLEPYDHVRILPRFNGWPLPPVELPIVTGSVEAAEIRKAILDGPLHHALSLAMASWLETRGLNEAPKSGEFFFNNRGCKAALLVSVVVCTRDRPNQLKKCLDSLTSLSIKPHEIIVIDNAPSDESTELLVHNAYPGFRYIRECRPGLDWARNTGVHAATGDIVAFTDDDVTVDPGWIQGLCDGFATGPDVVAVTGLVEPADLSTDAQQIFELDDGFGRGYDPIWTRVPSFIPERWQLYGAGQYGTGANMAFKKSTFAEIGDFDPALDVGTPTNGGGDLEMLARVLASGGVLCYWPGALVFHHHRKEYIELRYQIENNGRGFLAFLIAFWERAPSERPAIRRLFLWWAFKWLLWPAYRYVIRASGIVDLLRVHELNGLLRNPLSYRQAKRRVRKIIAEFGGEPSGPKPRSFKSRLPALHSCGAALREIDLCNPLIPINDASDYERIGILVRKGNEVLGELRFAHHGRTIGAFEIAWRLQAEYQKSLYWHMAQFIEPSGPASCSCETVKLDFTKYVQAAPRHYNSKVETALASIVVASLDRPDQLRRCLDALIALNGKVSFEIIVVDNNPASGLTVDVTQAFSQVRYLSEANRGLSYARNAGIRTANGSIIVCIDDDVIVPPHWLDVLCKPFGDSRVAAVTGNVIPASLKNSFEILFEKYGGLGRGYVRRVFDRSWLEASRHAPPTWEIGATANAAFRSSIFFEERIGLFDEALGAGTPTGCSEDTYLFYRILSAGYRIIYEPDAYVRHVHRTTKQALLSQLFAYSKGHVAYLLVTWLQDGDRRVFRRLFLTLPSYCARKLLFAIVALITLKKPDGPAIFTMVEILGYIFGPVGLLRSRRRVKRLRQLRDLSVSKPLGLTSVDSVEM